MRCVDPPSSHVSAALPLTKRSSASPLPLMCSASGRSYFSASAGIVPSKLYRTATVSPSATFVDREAQVAYQPERGSGAMFDLLHGVKYGKVSPGHLFKEAVDNGLMPGRGSGRWRSLHAGRECIDGVGAK